MEKVKIHSWDGFRLSASDVSIVIVPDIGGRILSLSHNGQEILFVQKEHAGEAFDFSGVTDLHKEKQRLGFRLWGGDKTWIAPEKEWWEKIPPLELDAGRYEVKTGPQQIEMISPVCRETGLQLIRSVAMQNSGDITLTQTLVNKSRATVHRGIWDVTQLLKPFDVFVPTAQENVRSYHREDPTLPPHNVEVRETDGLSCIPCRDNQMFKFGGGRLKTGAILSLREDSRGTLALLKTFDVGPEAAYLHRSVVEVFNAKDHDYLEVEVHAPAIPLEPGQKTSHSQTWRLNRYPRSMSPRQIFDEMTRT